jgi:hypothetical protein
MIGKTISHHRIFSQLRGGMGVVYEAKDHKPRRLGIAPRASVQALDSRKMSTGTKKG